MTRVTLAVVVWAGAIVAAGALSAGVAGSIDDDQVAAVRKAATVVCSAHDIGHGAAAPEEGKVGAKPRGAAAVTPTSPRSLFPGPEPDRQVDRPA